MNAHEANTYHTDTDTSPWTAAFAMDCLPTESWTGKASSQYGTHEEDQPTQDALADIYNRPHAE